MCRVWSQPLKPRRGGSGFDRKKCSSNLLLVGSACFSVGHSRFNLATARVITSTSSSYWAEGGGSSAFSPSPSSEDDSLSVEPSPRGEETAPSERASEPCEVALDLVVEEEEKDLPISIPSTRFICDPHVTTPLPLLTIKCGVTIIYYNIISILFFSSSEWMSSVAVFDVP